MQLKPTKLSRGQALKVLKTAAWIAGSGAVTALVTWATDNKEAFGYLWPLVNLSLVTAKQFFSGE